MWGCNSQKLHARGGGASKSVKPASLSFPTSRTVQIMFATPLVQGKTFFAELAFGLTARARKLS